MSDRLRLFVAFEVPEDVRIALRAALAETKRTWTEARWTAVEAQHVTLKFLGWIERDRVAGVEAMCRQIAAEVAPSQVALGPLGAFPKPGRARVVWAGIEDPAGVTASLAARLDEASVSLGVEPEDRAYRPHLTLCRFPRPRPLDDLPQVPRPGQRNFFLEEIVLFRSHLSSQGARYEALDRFPLAPQA